MTQPNGPTPEVVVIDANVPIAIAANEPGEGTATAAVNAYLAQACVSYAPGAIEAEVLYVLCGKHADGSLTDEEHEQAIDDFSLFMWLIRPPPAGESSLVRRAAAVRGSYSCRRSADGIYIALAEELAGSYPTSLLTFDADMAKQAARTSATLSVDLLAV